jgi:AraC-like DNA-binding protein/mannose-6-phosphate isomerase-like protein (cupin superfamily)
MTGTPTLFADTPTRVTCSGGAPDLLSEMLRAVRLTGSVFFSGSFTAPCAVISPKRWNQGTPLAHLRHISVFHLVVSGDCSMELASGERREIAAGDVLLMPFADQHKFWKGNPTEIAYLPDIVRPGPIEGTMTVRYGGGGEDTRAVCGFLESSECLFTPVFRTLPPLVIDRVDDDKVGALIASTVREIVTLVDAAKPGSQMMLGRLMEALFVEMLRRHVERLPRESTGWLAALNDPIVGRALKLVHAAPARRWTADDLAREAGSSRTVLAERFNALLGKPPIEYVTSWRIQLAAERLRGSQESIASIAADVGYESEAAFNRAFKRVTGVTPGRWRDEKPIPTYTRSPHHSG